MTSQKQLHTDEAPPDSNLIHLEKETRAVGQASDINAKIGLLETSLTDLQKELDVINRSVDEGLERLSDSDLDLTSKVSETYKRLGEIDNTYKTLSVISENIDNEVKKLTTEIEDVAARSATDLENHNQQMTEQHEQLVERVNDLVRHSHETNLQLSQSIKDNTDALLKLEKELVAEIDALATATSQRSENIEKELENSKARILQLQSVDDALEKRATSLESTAARLTQASKELDASLDLLEMRADELSSMVDKLLEDSEKHASLIGTLQDKSIELALSVKALATTENRHFKILSGFLVLAILAIAGLYFYHQSEMSHDAIVTAERTQVVDQQITGLQQSNLKSAVTISEIQHNLVSLNEKLEGEVKVLNGKLQTMNDQADSLDGRISSISPFSQIGGSNVIHGPQWLSQQPADHYAIQVASVGDKTEMYDIAQRYNPYLKDELSYYTAKSANGDKFVLVSGGYATRTEADAVVWRLPRYVNFQRPAVTRMAAIQQQL
ncbi:MAG: SPOR domain-containing protein [Thiotrichales bacterium]|nr:MAG: SPOR domain-containing protein [Thiotrichales bacterium]